MVGELVLCRTGLEGVPLGSDWNADNIGRKGWGLCALPSSWCPPFIVITTAAYGRWHSEHTRNFQTGAELAWLLKDGDLRNKADQVFGTNIQRIIIRSSALKEGLDDRGRFSTEACLNNDDCILSTTLKIWNHADQNLLEESGGGLALIVQPLLIRKTRGHLSNERRLCKRPSDWVCEFEKQKGGVVLERFVVSDTNRVLDEALYCSNREELLARLQQVSAVSTGLWERVHYEWVWDGTRLWIVQRDVEDLVVGKTPGSERPQRETKVMTPLSVLVMAERSRGAWHKIACTNTFRTCGLPTQPIFVLENEQSLRELESGQIHQALEEDLRALLCRDIVVRTDVKENSEVDQTLLPRTCTMSELNQVVGFLTKTAKDLSDKGIKSDQFCFLFHHYVPAKGGALALATPGSTIVKIDSTWGLPDGLLYYPHDSFQVTLIEPRKVLSRVRCKEYYIDCDSRGHWDEKRAGIPWDWEVSLGRSDVLQIAEWTRKIADQLSRSVEVMYFTGVDLGGLRLMCLPWYYDTGKETSHGKKRRSITASVFGKNTIRVRDDNDLNRLRELAEAHRLQKGLTLRLTPDHRLLRSPDFLTRVSRCAMELNLPVQLEGSLLSHVFYTLRRHGVKLKLPRAAPSRPRRRRYHKLVRDRVPEIIRARGEESTIIRVDLKRRPELLKAKLIEEALEVFWETDREGTIRELTDLLEVIRATCQALDYSLDELIITADRRRADRGGFDKGQVLLDTRPAGRVEESRQPSLFDRILEPPTEPALISGFGLIRPEVPRIMGTGVMLPLIPPHSLSPGVEYEIRSADGNIALSVSYKDRSAHIRFIRLQQPTHESDKTLFDNVPDYCQPDASDDTQVR